MLRASVVRRFFQFRVSFFATLAASLEFMFDSGESIFEVAQSSKVLGKRCIQSVNVVLQVRKSRLDFLESLFGSVSIR